MSLRLQGVAALCVASLFVACQGARPATEGSLESTRTWTAPGRSITCAVRLDGEGPLATLAVTGQARCQVSAL